MKKTLMLGAAVVASLALSTGCKKGEEDPFLSFRSRDARITGTWELSEYSSTETTTTVENTSNDVNSDKNDFEETVTETESYSGSNWVTTTHTVSTNENTSSSYDFGSLSFQSETNTTETDRTETETTSHTMSITLYKDNTYKVEMTQTDVSYEFEEEQTTNGTGFTTSSDTTYSPADTDTDNTDHGEWYWMDSNKKKIAISAGPLSGHILQLKNKELIITNNTTENDQSTDHNPTSLSTHNDNDPGETEMGIEKVETTYSRTYEERQVWTKTDKNSKRD